MLELNQKLLLYSSYITQYTSSLFPGTWQTSMLGVAVPDSPCLYILDVHDCSSAHLISFHLQ